MRKALNAIKPLHAVFIKQFADFRYDELILAESNLQTNLQCMNNVFKQTRDILSKDHHSNHLFLIHHPNNSKFLVI